MFWGPALAGAQAFECRSLETRAQPYCPGRGLWLRVALERLVVDTRCAALCPERGVGLHTGSLSSRNVAFESAGPPPALSFRVLLLGRSIDPDLAGSNSAGDRRYFRRSPIRVCGSSVPFGILAGQFRPFGLSRPARRPFCRQLFQVLGITARTISKSSVIARPSGSRSRCLGRG
jgi:hypothetical protein